MQPAIIYALEKCHFGLVNTNQLRYWWYEDMGMGCSASFNLNDPENSISGSTVHISVLLLLVLWLIYLQFSCYLFHDKIEYNRKAAFGISYSITILCIYYFISNIYFEKQDDFLTP